MIQLRKFVYRDKGINMNFLYNEPKIVKVNKVGWLLWLGQLFGIRERTLAGS